MRWIAPTAAFLLLAGCTCTLDAPSPAPIAYRCDDGARFTADYDPMAQQVTILRPGAAPMVMVQTVSGSGVRYRNGDQVFHTKGPNGLWITGNTSVVGCHELAPG